jgi:pimeloyl-ACP methyl ester carboxylesterase
MSGHPIPGWFARAVAAPFRERTVDVDGCPIGYLDWGDPDDPGLVFVHGGAAHAHWWSFLAPLFLDRWRAVALDLSGHGDSGRRPAYSHPQWAREVVAVAEHAALPGPPVVVGHSMGGLVAIQTAADHCERLAGVIVVDAPVRRPDPESEARRSGSVFRTPGTYPTWEAALEHFRLVPPQPVADPHLTDHIARRSVRETPAGWTWKFDPLVFEHPRISLRDQLASVDCRLAFLRGEHSVVVPPDTASYMAELLDETAPVISIPEAHHHVMLDRPLELVGALRALLEAWGRGEDGGGGSPYPGSAAGPSSGAMHSG